MLALYIFAAIIGGGLMVASAFVGHGHEGELAHDVDGLAHDTDLSHDADHDSGAAHVGHAADWIAWLPFFSVRFWTYAIGTFGIAGVLLSLLAKTGEPLTAGVSALTGIFAGSLAATVLKLLRVTEASSGPQTNDLLGSRGVLLVGCGPGKDGKFRGQIKGEILEMLALPQSDAEIASGTDVVIVGVESDRAIVVSTAEIMADQ